MSENFKKSLHIYICHYTKYTERKKYIQGQLDKLKLDPNNIHFIEEYDAGDYDPIIDQKIFLDLDTGNNKNIAVKKASWYARKTQPRKLRDSEKSLALKHINALNKIKKSNNDYGLVIEDDCYFCNNFLKKLELVVKNLPNNWSVYVANSTINMLNRKGLNRIIADNNYVVRRKHPSTAGTVSYLIKKNCAERVVDDIKKNKISWPIDWEYNWLFKKLGFHNYYNRSEEPLVYCAEFDNNINTNNSNSHSCVMIKI